MTDKQVKEILQQHGYIALSDYNQNNIADVYDSNDTLVGRCHAGAIDRIKGANGVTVWRDFSGVLYAADYMSRQYRDHENRRRCKHIADDLSAYAEGAVYTCPECGAEVQIPDTVGDRFCCPQCNETTDTDSWDQCSVYDYFSDCLDIEYRCSAQKEFRSVQINVACGGPNIYVDTASQKVELYWWGDSADWPIDSDAIEAIDDWAEEYWRCI